MRIRRSSRSGQTSRKNILESIQKQKQEEPVSKNFKNFAKMNQVMNMSLSSARMTDFHSRKKSIPQFVRDPNPPLRPKMSSRNGSENGQIKLERQSFKMNNLKLIRGSTPKIDSDALKLLESIHKSQMSTEVGTVRKTKLKDSKIKYVRKNSNHAALDKLKINQVMQIEQLKRQVEEQKKMLNEARREIAEAKKAPPIVQNDLKDKVSQVGDWVLETKGAERWVKKTAADNPLP